MRSWHRNTERERISGKRLEKSNMNWNQEWERICREKPYNREVRICFTQEEVDRANGMQLPVLGIEEIPDENYSDGADHLRNCSYIIQLDRESILKIKGRRPASSDCKMEGSEETEYQAGDDCITEEELRKIYCRFHHIPMRILETERTILREISMEDLPALYRIYQEPGFTDFMEDLPPIEEERQQLKTYIHDVYGFYDYGLWAVTDRETGELIGRGGIERKSQTLSGLELSYGIAPHLQHQGLGEEVVRAVVRYAAHILPEEQIFARVRTGNLPSIRLLERLGFQRFRTEKSIQYYDYSAKSPTYMLVKLPYGRRF